MAGTDDPRAANEAAPELSAIVLCFRTGEAVTAVIEPLYSELSEAEIDFELVLVGNYDSDDDPTPALVQEFAREHESAKAVVQRKQQGGMGWDMRAGFEDAGGSTMIVMDGDTQNPTEDVLRMYWAMRRTGADVMKGRRITRLDGPYRRFISAVYNAIFRVMFGTGGLRDINGKPKGLTRDAYERISPLTSDDWFIDAEIVIKAHRQGMSITELPVVFLENEERASFVHAGAIWEFVVNLVRFWWRR